MGFEGHWYTREKFPVQERLLDVPAADYHAHRALGSSDVRTIHKSPLHFHHAQENPVNSNAKALVVGSATHTAALEPENFDDEFQVMPPEIDGKGPRTGYYREAMEELKAEKPDVRWLSPSDYDLVMSMAESALSHPVLQRLLDKEHKVEGTAYFRTWRTLCKCRPDMVAYGKGNEVEVLDLKTTMDASPGGFAKTCANWGYDVQQEFYTRGLELNGFKVKKFTFLAVEKTPPYVCGSYELDRSQFTVAKEIIRKACAVHMDCKTRDVWPGYGKETQRINLPAWRIPKESKSVDPTGKPWATMREISNASGLSYHQVYRIKNRLKDKLEWITFGNRLIINMDSWNEHYVGHHKPKTKTTNDSTTIKTETKVQENGE